MVTELGANPSTVATGGPKGMLGAFSGSLYLHMTDATDTNWLNLSSINTRIASALSAGQNAQTAADAAQSDADAAQAAVDALAVVPALAANPTLTATAGAVHALGTFGGSLFVHLSVGTNTNWLNLSGVKNREAMMVQCQRVVITAADLKAGENGALATGVLFISPADVGAARILNVRATLSDPFSFSGADTSFNLMVGTYGNNPDSLLRSFAVGSAGVTGTVGTVGSRCPSDDDINLGQVELRFVAEAGKTMSMLLGGAVVFEVFFI